MKGLDYAEAQFPFIDKTRECALGASYGGFMADWVLTHTDRFKCIVTHDGMFDPVSAYGSTEEMWFNEWEFRRPEDFPKGWDGFSASYDPMGHSASTNAGLLPLRARAPVGMTAVGGWSCCRAVAIPESAGGAGPVPQVVADAVHRECEDADADHPFAAGLPAGCVAGL